MDSATKKILFLIAIPLLFVALPAYPWGWDRDYESCILNHIEDAKSERAASLVALTCRKKYPMTEEECVKEAKAKGNEFAAIDCYQPKCLNASYWSKHFGDCKE